MALSLQGPSANKEELVAVVNEKLGFHFSEQLGNMTADLNTTGAKEKLDQLIQDQVKPSQLENVQKEVERVKQVDAQVIATTSRLNQVVTVENIAKLAISSGENEVNMDGVCKIREPCAGNEVWVVVTNACAAKLGEATSLAIATVADGTEREVREITMELGEKITFYAVARDAAENFVGLETVNWGVTANLGSLDQTAGLSVVFTLDSAGTGTINITHDNLIVDTEGVKIVSSNPPAIGDIENQTINDQTAPTMLTHSLSPDNAYIDVSFSEGLYNRFGGGAIEAADLAIIFYQK